MKNTHAEKLIAAYLSGNTDASEEEKLMSWVDESPESQKFFDKTEEIWNIADQGEYPDFSKGKAKAWSKLDNRLFDEEQSSPTPTAKIRSLGGLQFSKIIGIAASLALLLTVGWWLQSSDAFNVQTLASEQKMVELPDGTKVWLNENSQLAYEDLGDERSLIFSGEAYFDVQTDSLKPFNIYSGRALTSVMGTAFNLRAYPDEQAVEVSVTEGKVALTQVNKEAEAAVSRVELTVGQTGVFEKEEALVKKLEQETVQNKTAWKDKRLNFDELKFSQALPAIERYFDVKIILENQDLLNCNITGDYENPRLDEVLAFLNFVFLIEAERIDNTIHLKGGTCSQ